MRIKVCGIALRFISFRFNTVKVQSKDLCIKQWGIIFQCFPIVVRIHWSNCCWSFVYMNDINVKFKIISHTCTVHVSAFSIVCFVSIVLLLSFFFSFCCLLLMFCCQYVWKKSLSYGILIEIVYCYWNDQIDKIWNNYHVSTYKMCQSNLIPLVSPITVVIHETFMDALIMNPLKVFCTIMSSISRCICTHIIRTPLQKKKYNPRTNH